MTDTIAQYTVEERYAALLKALKAQAYSEQAHGYSSEQTTARYAQRLRRLMDRYEREAMYA